jgi:F-type H+-transporting ATPase subunit delta
LVIRIRRVINTANHPSPITRSPDHPILNPVARRYALALYEEARVRSVADAVDADVRSLGESLRTIRELRAALTSPVISRTRKEVIVKRLFDGRVHPLVTSFLLLLIRKEREELAPAVVEAYTALVDEREGVLEARVRSARPLSADQAEALRKRLEAGTGRSIRLHMDVDPALLGGLVVRVADRVHDGSLRHQLDLLHDQLVSRAQVMIN